jgi:hypothetical protein
MGDDVDVWDGCHRRVGEAGWLDVLSQQVGQLTRRCEASGFICMACQARPRWLMAHGALSNSDLVVTSYRSRCSVAPALCGTLLRAVERSPSWLGLRWDEAGALRLGVRPSRAHAATSSPSRVVSPFLANQKARKRIPRPGQHAFVSD